MSAAIPSVLRPCEARFSHANRALILTLARWRTILRIRTRFAAANLRLAASSDLGIALLMTIRLAQAARWMWVVISR